MSTNIAGTQSHDLPRKSFSAEVSSVKVRVGRSVGRRQVDTNYGMRNTKLIWDDMASDWVSVCAFVFRATWEKRTITMMKRQ